MNKAFLLGALFSLSLSGCGFQPLYGSNAGHTSMDRSLSQVRVAQVGDRLGVLITNSLRDSFNPDAMGVVPRYLLTVSLAESSGDETIRSDATASRTALTLSANWSLRTANGGRTIDSGTANANAGFDVLESNDYANVTSRRTQEERMVKEVTQEIELRVAMAVHKIS